MRKVQAFKDAEALKVLHPLPTAHSHRHPQALSDYATTFRPAAIHIKS